MLRSHQDWPRAASRRSALHKARSQMARGHQLNKRISLEERHRQTRALVNMLTTIPQINSMRIACTGHSLGAFAAPRSPAVIPQIAGLILMAGNTRPLESLSSEQTRYEVSLNANHARRTAGNRPGRASALPIYPVRFEAGHDRKFSGHRAQTTCWICAHIVDPKRAACERIQSSFWQGAI